MSLVCAGCKAHIKSKDYMVCSTCKLHFDLECSNIAVKRFHKFSSEAKKNWNCCGCSSRVPRSDNTNTPVRSAAPCSFENITQRNPSKLMPRRASSGDSPESLGCSVESVGNKEIRTLIREEITSAMKSFTRELKNVAEKVSSFENSLMFFNTCFEELKKSVEEKTELIDQLHKSNEELKFRVTKIENEVTHRLNLMEQHQRECNVEINGVPENRSENVIKIIEQLAGKMECSISDADVVHVSRVAKINRDNDRPRTIVLRLRTRLLRDRLLASVQKFNKDNARDKLNSAHLGIGGNCVPVFVSEHLSPANKSLHAAARKKAKDLRYKFVWVRDGRIYARKDETSSAVHIRTLNSPFFAMACA